MALIAASSIYLYTLKADIWVKIVVYNASTSSTMVYFDSAFISSNVRAVRFCLVMLMERFALWLEQLVCIIVEKWINI